CRSTPGAPRHPRQRGTHLPFAVCPLSGPPPALRATPASGGYICRLLFALCRVHPRRSAPPPPAGDTYVVCRLPFVGSTPGAPRHPRQRGIEARNKFPPLAGVAPKGPGVDR